MKRYLLFFLMILQAMYVVSSDKVEKLYQQHMYQEILDTYALKNDNNAATWCLVGNVAYCLRKYNEAYLYWLRAQQDGNAEIYYISAQNIYTLQKQGFVPSEHKVYTWLIWFSKYVGIYILQFFFLFVWYALCMMLYKRKIRFLVVSGMLLVACCLLMPIIAAYNFDEQKGLIMEDATIYNGPNNAYYTIGSVPKGSLVMVKSTQDDWIKIIYKDTIGWIGRTDVGLLRANEFETKTSSTSSLLRKN